MKKVLATVFLTFFASLQLFALSVTGHLGYLSGVGIKTEVNQWELGADLESSFPCIAIYSGISNKDSNVTFKEGFVLGLKESIGINVSAYRMFDFIGVGAESSFTANPMIGKINLSVRPSLKANIKISEKACVFVCAGIPLLHATYIKGFEKPLVLLFDFSTYSSLLECFKAGASIKL